MATTTASASHGSQVGLGGWVLRGALMLLSWAVCVFLVATVVQAAGIAGEAAGRVVSVLAVLVALVPTWFLVRRARRRWWLMGATVVLLVAVGLGLGRLAGPSLARMTSAGSTLPLATGAQLLTTSSSERTWCADECSRVTYVYAVPEFDAAEAELRAALAADGWSPRPTGQLCRGELGVSVTADAGPDVVTAPDVPEGMTVLSVTTSRCGS